MAPWASLYPVEVPCLDVSIWVSIWRDVRYSISVEHVGDSFHRNSISHSITVDDDGFHRTLLPNDLCRVVYYMPASQVSPRPRYRMRNSATQRWYSQNGQRTSGSNIENHLMESAFVLLLDEKLDRFGIPPSNILDGSYQVIQL